MCQAKFPVIGDMELPPLPAVKRGLTTPPEATPPDPVADDTSAVQAYPVPEGWQDEFYVKDWTAEKRHRFEQLSAVMEWDLESIKHAAHALAGANVVVIADDSGSMGSSVRNSPVAPPPGKYTTTRWDELIHFLQLVLQVAAELADGVHFHFLNAGCISKVQAWEQVEAIAARGPTRGTPLLSAMREVFEKYNPAKTDRKLLTIIATDGCPTDGPTSGVSAALRARPCIDRSFVTFLSCTDNDSDIAYIKQLDADLEHIDEVDDYNTERAEVLRHGASVYQNFSMGDWVLRAACGAAVPEWDRSDEHQHVVMATPCASPVQRASRQSCLCCGGRPE